MGHEVLGNNNTSNDSFCPLNLNLSTRIEMFLRRSSVESLLQLVRQSLDIALLSLVGILSCTNLSFGEQMQCSAVIIHK